ncbi:MAG: HAMP domain-containing protein [Candidatus Wallbacteria bacterium]|nr:HAMP domain-containing protein [Candidatus Wallbacteria bacterium]
MSRNRRTRFLIKKGLQFRYMAVILMTMLFLSLISGWTIYSTIWEHLTMADMKVSANLHTTFNKINSDLMVRVPAFAILLSFASLFISHRIAGPIYRFEQSAKTISSGDLTMRVKLRKGDELQSLADCFNQMAENLETLVGTDRNAISQIIQVIKIIPVELRSPDIPESRKSEIVAELIKVVENLKSITCSFRIKGQENDDEPDVCDMQPRDV